jgi:hypothetical protein
MSSLYTHGKRHKRDVPSRHLPRASASHINVWWNLYRRRIVHSELYLLGFEVAPCSIYFGEVLSGYSIQENYDLGSVSNLNG